MLAVNIVIFRVECGVVRMERVRRLGIRKEVVDLKNGCYVEVIWACGRNGCGKIDDSVVISDLR